MLLVLTNGCAVAASESSAGKAANPPECSEGTLVPVVNTVVCADSTGQTMHAIPAGMRSLCRARVAHLGKDKFKADCDAKTLPMEVVRTLIPTGRPCPPGLFAVEGGASIAGLSGKRFAASHRIVAASQT